MTDRNDLPPDPDRDVTVLVWHRELDPKKLDASSLAASALKAPWREGPALRWPVRTLVAWAWNGLSREGVRALLGRGEWVADMHRVQWTPLFLDGAALDAIERTFPPPLAEPAREPTSGPADVRLVTPVPPARPLAWMSLDRRATPVREAAGRWRYAGFDTAAWGDRWETVVGPDEARALARVATTTRVGGRELAARLGVPVPDAVEQAGGPSGAGERAEEYLSRLMREIAQWYEELFVRAAREPGVYVRFTGPRPGEMPPWPSESAAWRPRP